jgi:hypothetical protein
MDNQELQQSATAASALQSSFAPVAQSVIYGVSTTAAIIPIPKTHRVISLKLSNTNLMYWRMQMKPFLFGQSVYSFVDGTSLCPPSHLASTATSALSVNLAY